MVRGYDFVRWFGSWTDDNLVKADDNLVRADDNLVRANDKWKSP